MATVEITRPRDGVALVTLNRPAALNAMNAELIADLHAAFATLRPDRLIGASRAYELMLTGRSTREPHPAAREPHRGHDRGGRRLPRQARPHVRGRVTRRSLA